MCSSPPPQQSRSWSMIPSFQHSAFLFPILYYPPPSLFSTEAILPAEYLPLRIPPFVPATVRSQNWEFPLWPLRQCAYNPSSDRCTTLGHTWFRLPSASTCRPQTRPQHQSFRRRTP